MGLLFRCVLATALFAACSFQSGVPADVLITCENDRECPRGLRCQTTRGQCRPSEGFDDQLPGLLGVQLSIAPLPACPLAQPTSLGVLSTLEVDLQATEALAEAPRITTEPPVELACTLRSLAGARAQLSCTLAAGTSEERSVTVRAQLTDVEGLGATVSVGVVTIDTLPPRQPDTLPEGSLTVRVAPWGDAISADDRLELRAGATFERPPVLEVVDHLARRVALLEAAALANEAPVPLATRDPRLEVRAIDRAGNVSGWAPVHWQEWVAGAHDRPSRLSPHRVVLDPVMHTHEPPKDGTPLAQQERAALIDGRFESSSGVASFTPWFQPALSSRTPWDWVSGSGFNQTVPMLDRPPSSQELELPDAGRVVTWRVEPWSERWVGVGVDAGHGLWLKTNAAAPWRRVDPQLGGAAQVLADPLTERTFVLHPVSAPPPALYQVDVAELLADGGLVSHARRVPMQISNNAPPSWSLVFAPEGRLAFTHLVQDDDRIYGSSYVIEVDGGVSTLSEVIDQPESEHLTVDPWLGRARWRLGQPRWIDGGVMSDFTRCTASAQAWALTPAGEVMACGSAFEGVSFANLRPSSWAALEAAVGPNGSRPYVLQGGAGAGAVCDLRSCTAELATPSGLHARGAEVIVYAAADGGLVEYVVDLSLDGGLRQSGFVSGLGPLKQATSTFSGSLLAAVDGGLWHWTVGAPSRVGTIGGQFRGLATDPTTGRASAFSSKFTSLGKEELTWSEHRTTGLLSRTLSVSGAGSLVWRPSIGAFVQSNSRLEYARLKPVIRFVVDPASLEFSPAAQVRSISVRAVGQSESSIDGGSSPGIELGLWPGPFHVVRAVADAGALADFSVEGLQLERLRRFRAVWTFSIAPAGTNGDGTARIDLDAVDVTVRAFVP